MYEEFKLKNLGDYHDFYVQSDTSLLADVFENFRSKCIKTYEINSARFLSAPKLAWQPSQHATSWGRPLKVP